MNPRDEHLESWHKPKPAGVEFEATKTYKNIQISPKNIPNSKKAAAVDPKQ